MIVHYNYNPIFAYRRKVWLLKLSTHKKNLRCFKKNSVSIQFFHWVLLVIFMYLLKYRSSHHQRSLLCRINQKIRQCMMIDDDIHCMLRKSYIFKARIVTKLNSKSKWVLLSKLYLFKGRSFVKVLQKSRKVLTK